LSQNSVGFLHQQFPVLNPPRSTLPEAPFLEQARIKELERENRELRRTKAPALTISSPGVADE
jgi:hypothetical protein